MGGYWYHHSSYTLDFENNHWFQTWWVQHLYLNHILEWTSNSFVDFHQSSFTIGSSSLFSIFFEITNNQHANFPWSIWTWQGYLRIFTQSTCSHHAACLTVSDLAIDFDSCYLFSCLRSEYSVWPMISSQASYMSFEHYWKWLFQGFEPIKTLFTGLHFYWSQLIESLMTSIHYHTTNYYVVFILYSFVLFRILAGLSHLTGGLCRSWRWL